MGLFGATEVLRPTSGYPVTEPWDMSELLHRERASLGFYLSGHPLDRYASEVARLTSASSQALAEMRDGTEVKLAGVIEGYRERVPKSGGRMAFFELEDRTGRVEVIVRPKMYAELDAALDREAKQTIAGTVFREGEAVLVTGKVKVDLKRDESGEIDDSVDEAQLARKLMLQTVAPLGDALKANARGFQVRLSPAVASEKRLGQLRDALAKHPGRCPVSAVLRLPDGAEVVVALPSQLRVDPSDALMASVERIFGEKVAELR
jgi:DNA polymerase-3 subunit alpha